MKYTISEEEVQAVAQVLYNLDIGAKTLTSIKNTLTQNPIKEDKPEEVIEEKPIEGNL